MGQLGPDQPGGPEGGQPRDARQPSSSGQRQPGSPIGGPEQLKELQRERQARLAKVIVALAIVVILIIFVIANADPVKVNFVFVTRHPRLIWVMIACAVLGGIVGYLIGRPGRQIGARNKAKGDRHHQ
jgi:uncharacterized integral membrane protein